MKAIQILNQFIQKMQYAMKKAERVRHCMPLSAFLFHLLTYYGEASAYADFVSTRTASSAADAASSV